MKRLLSAVIAAVLMVPLFGAPAKAGETMSYEELVVKVEQTNNQINMEINKAAAEANELVKKYEAPLMIAATIENPKIVVDKLSVVSNELNQLSQAYNMTKSLTSTTNVSININELKYKLSSVSGQTSTAFYSASVLSNIIYASFEKELDKIINNLIDVTNRLSKDLIREAALSGYTIESEWIEVAIGGRVILVDPCRVVGF